MSDSAINNVHQPASAHTTAHNQAAQEALNTVRSSDKSVHRGLIAQLQGPITTATHTCFDPSAWDFVHGDVPETVNPSLWRQAQYNSAHGLFEVADGVWQARGYDLANITFIAGDTGWLIIDPLTTEETSAACLKLANDTLGERPVRAVIYTHSHIDHFGGVYGVVTEESVRDGEVQIVAPAGFMDEAIAENVIAGPAMGRRAHYQFGSLLEPGPTGHVDAGLGKRVARGTPGLIAPTIDITETGQELRLDGIRIVFHNTPDAEAPAEMNFFFPDKRLLCMAENCTQTMHNLYTPRGALIRDALAWSRYINEALEMFGADTDVVFASHHWPTWGGDECRAYLARQADLYRWIHDQTIRYANSGMTAVEIAEKLSLPACFAEYGDTRGYYGTVNHNVKAVYQRYLGWYDANPANLHPHPPEVAGQRYVDFMGGSDAVLAKAQESFDEGDYRWVAQVVNHLVFAEPDNVAAKDLQASALEQLGYQSESGPWRNMYLTGAQELRVGVPEGLQPPGGKLLRALTIEQIFAVFGVRLRAEDVVDAAFTINWHFPDIGEHHVLGLRNCAVHHVPNSTDSDAEVSLTVDKSTLIELFARQTTFEEVLAANKMSIEGDANDLFTLFGSLEQAEVGFAIVTP